MQKIIKCLILSILISFSLNNAWASDKIIAITDLHFDPFFDCKIKPEQPCPIAKRLQMEDAKNWGKIFRAYSSSDFPTYHQNTNFALLQSMLKAVGKVQQRTPPRFALILGDFLAYQINTDYAKFSGDPSQEGYERFIKKTMQFLTLQIKQALPNTNIYPVIGNNDSYTGDYGIIPNGKFFAETGNTWSSFFINQENRRSFLKDFKNAGYYSTLIPETHHRIIVLNTTLFLLSPWMTVTQDIEDAAKQEIVWFENQLTMAEKNNEQVLIAIHAPFGIDVYATLNNPLSHLLRTPQPFFRDPYAQDFKENLDKHASVIAAVIQSHIHKDIFQVLTLNKGVNIPVMTVPSIAPIYNNNPGFKVYEYENSPFRFKNYDAYFVPLQEKNKQWALEYNFNQKYQPECHTCTLLDGFQKLLADKNKALLRGYYQSYYEVGSNNVTISEANIKYYRCSITELNKLDYQICLNAH